MTSGMTPDALKKMMKDKKDGKSSKSKGIFIDGYCPLSKIGYTISRELVELAPDSLLAETDNEHEHPNVAGSLGYIGKINVQAKST